MNQCAWLILIGALYFPCSMSLAQDRCALDFDGINDRVTVPYDASFPGDVYTVAAWIRLSEPGHRSAIIARGEDDDSWDLSWHLYVRPEGTLQLMVENSDMQNSCYPEVCFQSVVSDGCTLHMDASVSDDQWHHVAATRYANGRMVFYIDGMVMAECEGTTVPSPDNMQDLTIGCTHGYIGPPPGGEEPPIWFFPGLIDEPAMWNVALTDAQVLELHASGVDVLSEGLVGYWEFDEGSGQDVVDLSPAQNDGFRGEFNDDDAADPQWEVPEGCGALPSDLNNDGVVNAADLAILLGFWGPCEECPADLFSDGVVDGADLAMLLANWT